jgi:hypothetical protein
MRAATGRKGNFKFLFSEGWAHHSGVFVFRKKSVMFQNIAYAIFAKKVAHVCGKPRTFSMAFAVILIWILTGPLFGFSDTWQLVINTGTTIVTFLMVFLIQNTQNRDTEAIQLKLDELIRATQGAHNALLDLEELEEENLDVFKRKYQALAQLARQQLVQGQLDTDTPEP